VVSAGIIAPFLFLKYMTSLASPIMFSTMPLVMVNLCPLSTCGSRAGILACSHGIGRLLATAIVGPLYQYNPECVYYIVAVNGAFGACIFLLLYKALQQIERINIPFNESLDKPFLVGHALSLGSPKHGTPTTATPRRTMSMTLVTPDMSTTETAGLLMLFPEFDDQE
jgi:hypothetical protein